MSHFIVQTRGLTKCYGRQPSVNNIDLKVPAGSIYGLLGPNGAGKSTTLKLLTGLVRPDAGEIEIFGEPWQRRHLQRIGALIEQPALYGNLTAEENLLIHTTIMGLPKTEIDRVLDVVNLRGTRHKLVSRFSTGMKQRLGIAAALLGKPELLILDEPTNGLDPLGIQEFRRLVKSFPKMGITVILSSHVLTELGQLVDHVGIICDGRLRYQGAVERDTNLEELFMQVVRGQEG